GEVRPCGEPEVGLVDQGGRLKGVTGRLGRELCHGEGPQLVVDEGEEGSRTRRSRRSLVRVVVEVGHGGRVYARSSDRQIEKRMAAATGALMWNGLEHTQAVLAGVRLVPVGSGRRRLPRPVARRPE